jgi:probable HAF family extracellular repeat protein
MAAAATNPESRGLRLQQENLMHPISNILLAAATCVAIAPLCVAQPQAQPKYRVTVLSDFNTSSNAHARGYSINDTGIVAGAYRLAEGTTHASVWVFGQQIDLKTLGKGAALSSRVQWPVKNIFGLVSGISLTDALDPNQEGWSCGAFLANPNFNVCLGFVWDPITQTMRPLPTLGGTNGFATGTNNFGETVGWAENTVRDPTCVAPQILQFKPVMWGPGRNEIRALPLIGSDGSGAATALNDRGQVVGISGDCEFAVGFNTGRHAVLWDNGVAIEIANPFGTAAPWWNTPMMINELGDVVGFAGVPNDPDGNLTPAFRWNKKDGWHWIPFLQGDIASTASSINNSGVIVGYSNDANGNFHPWVSVNGVLRNLNDLIEPNSALTGAIELALDVNDRGEITGTTLSGQAIVLSPVW